MRSSGPDAAACCCRSPSSRRSCSAAWGSSPSSTGSSRRREAQGGIAVAAGVALVVIVAGYLQSRALPVGRRLPEAQRGPGSGRDRLGFRERLPGPVRADVAAAARSGRPSRRSSRVGVPRLLPGGSRGDVSPAESLSRGTTSRRARGRDSSRRRGARDRERSDRHLQARLRDRRPDGAPGARHSRWPASSCAICPARLRPFAWIGLLAVAVGFVWFALAGSIRRSIEAPDRAGCGPAVTRACAPPARSTSPRGARGSSPQ